jgi:hypothetical protein
MTSLTAGGAGTSNHTRGQGGSQRSGDAKQKRRWVSDRERERESDGCAMGEVGLKEESEVVGRFRGAGY